MDGFLEHEKLRVMEDDAVLKHFDNRLIEAIVNQERLGLSIEKVIEMQERLDKAPPSTEADDIRALLSSSTKPTILSFKIQRLINERIDTIANDPQLRQSLVEGSHASPQATTSPSPAVQQHRQASPQPAVDQPQQQPVSPPPHPAASSSPPRPPAGDSVLHFPHPRKYQLSSQLPPQARINVREKPDVSSAVVSVVDATNNVVDAVGIHDGSWLRIMVTSPTGESQVAYVLMSTPDIDLLVPVHQHPTIPTNEAPPRQSPVASPTTAPVQGNHVSMAEQTVAAPPPTASNPGPGFVTRQEYDQLAQRVAQLENELKRLTSVLRQV